jgi:hypothetical protein
VKSFSHPAALIDAALAAGRDRTVTVADGSALHNFPGARGWYIVTIGASGLLTDFAVHLDSVNRSCAALRPFFTTEGGRRTLADWVKCGRTPPGVRNHMEECPECVAARVMAS